MLALEPRASDDETLESEASIGTADSSENLNVDSEGAASDFSGEWLLQAHIKCETILKHYLFKLHNAFLCTTGNTTRIDVQ